MLCEPLRAHRSKLDEAGTTASRRNDGEDEHADGERNANQNQHGYSRALVRAGTCGPRDGRRAAVLRKADFKSIRETRSILPGVV